MSGQLSPDPILQFFAPNGQFLVAGLLYTYAAGTSTPQGVYADSALSTYLPNPIVLNAYGQPQTGSGSVSPVWLNPSQSYKFVLTDSAGNQLWTLDNIQGPLTGSQSLLPTVTNTYNIGSPSYTWANGYFGTALYVAGVPVPSYPQSAGEIAQSVTPSNYIYPVGHAWRYLTAAQLTDVQAFSFGTDPTAMTVSLQNWLNASYASRVSAYLPGGGYLISNTLYINQADQTNYRGSGFKIYGDGAGQVFVTPGSTGQGTTILQGNGNFGPLLQYKQYLPSGTSSGSYFIEKIRFQNIASSNTYPILQLDVVYLDCYVKNCSLYQAGTGHGLLTSEFIGGLFEQLDIINRDWLTPPGTRYGTGIAIGDQYNGGLATVRKVTSRGFLYGFTVGSGTSSLSSVAFYDCEVSNVTNGWYIYALNYNTLIDHCYNDGVTTGTIVIDSGNDTIIRDCYFNSGFTIGINGAGAGSIYGSVYAGNSLGIAGPTCTGIILPSSGAYGGPGLSCRDNYLAYNNAPQSGVIGIQISGIDPRIDGLSSNIFNPRGAWSGSGSYKIYDISTSSTGSPGSGVYGVAKANRGAASVSTAYDYEYPLVSRGALSLGRNRTPLKNTAVASRVLTLGQESLYFFSLSATITVGNGILGINDTAAVEGMRYTIVYVASSYTCAFAAGASMVIPSAGVIVPTAGALIEFQMDQGNAYLVGFESFA